MKFYFNHLFSFFGRIDLAFVMEKKKYVDLLPSEADVARKRAIALANGLKVMR